MYIYIFIFVAILFDLSLFLYKTKQIHSILSRAGSFYCFIIFFHELRNQWIFLSWSYQQFIHSVQNIVPLKWMSKSFFTKSRSIVILAALWQLEKYSDQSSCKRMSTVFFAKSKIIVLLLLCWQPFDIERVFLCAIHMTWSVESMPKKVQQRRFLANWAPRRFGAKLGPAKGLAPFRYTVN